MNIVPFNRMKPKAPPPFSPDDINECEGCLCADVCATMPEGADFATDEDYRKAMEAWDQACFTAALRRGGRPNCRTTGPGGA